MGLRWSRCAGWTHSVETAISGALFLGHAPPNGSRGAGKVETAIPMALYLGPDPDIDLAEVVKFHQPSRGLRTCDMAAPPRHGLHSRFTGHREGFVLATRFRNPQACPRFRLTSHRRGFVLATRAQKAITRALCLRHDELRFQGFRACFTSHRRGFVLATWLADLRRCLRARFTSHRKGFVLA